MDIIWDINQDDIQNVKNIIKQNENSFVLQRRIRNVEKHNIIITKDSIAKSLIMCLLTSQQRSGPDSDVSKFLRINPFPVTVDKILKSDDCEMLIKQTLQDNHLPRYINRISAFFTENMAKICEEGWAIIGQLDNLKGNPSKEAERKLADFFNDSFKGLGPKQARNFLQSLGLTKFEIPIDSRITTWLNNNGFPVVLTSAALGDKGYYHFISDGIQLLCEKAEEYPCILDAAIFSSYDNEGWTETNNVF